MGIYPDRTTVSDAINVLHKAGYRETDISVLSADNQGTKDFALEKHSKAQEGAASGAAVGAVVGAALAWLVSVQAVAIAGAMPLVVAGPWLAALAGAGAGGSVGFLAGMLAGLRHTEYVARRYAGRVRHGGILLSVHCDTAAWSEKAAKILTSSGARNVSTAAEAAADYGTTDRPTERSPLPASKPIADGEADRPIEGPPAVVLEPSEAPLRQTPDYVGHETKI